MRGASARGGTGAVNFSFSVRLGEYLAWSTAVAGTSICILNRGSRLEQDFDTPGVARESPRTGQHGTGS